VTVLVGFLVVVFGLCAALTSRQLNACRFDGVVSAAHLAGGRDGPQIREPLVPFEEIHELGIPLEMRQMLPAPPVVGFVMHHTCSACRDLWREVRDAPDMRDVVLVYSAAKRRVLESTGLLSDPAVALPEDLMDELPSSLVVAIDEKWRIAGRTIAQSLDDVRGVAATLRAKR
jgi:hypothetical protein